ncbi:MAG: hypothetical protein R2725_02535 [Solirubrobacterales bacterium]
MLASGERISEELTPRVVCRICGASRAVDPAVAPAPEPRSAGGFAVEQAEVTFWGVCPDCAPRCESSKKTG